MNYVMIDTKNGKYHISNNLKTVKCGSVNIRLKDKNEKLNTNKENFCSECFTE